MAPLRTARGGGLAGVAIAGIARPWMADMDVEQLQAQLVEVKDQLHMLGLKEIMARDAVGDEVAAFNALKHKLEKVESENTEFFETAIKRRNDAVGPAVMAELRRPSGMPFRKNRARGF